MPLLKGYELGAEHYVTKPFSMSILKKSSVILKRTGKAPLDIYDDGFLKIDFGGAKVEKGGSHGGFFMKQPWFMNKIC